MWKGKKIKMKHKIAILFMALCLILSSISIVMATDEEVENPTTVEIEQVEQVEEPAVEETAQKNVQSSNEVKQNEEVDPSTTSE